jgi:hypothetical protein
VVAELHEVAVVADLVVAALVVAALHEVARQAGADARLEVSARGGADLAELLAVQWSPSSPRGTSATSPRSTTRGGERLGVAVVAVLPAPSSCRRSRRRRW